MGWFKDVVLSLATPKESGDNEETRQKLDKLMKENGVLNYQIPQAEIDYQKSANRQDNKKTATRAIEEIAGTNKSTVSKARKVKTEGLER